jgi:uncharacterized protein YndB with AHSA1/START domain
MNDPMLVHVVRTIPAPRPVVFDAWLDAKRLVKFMVPAPGMSVTGEKVDPRVGGGFEFIFIAGESRIPHQGEYKIIDRYDRLAFSWISPHSPPTSVVTLTFEEIGPRSTRLTLDQTGLPNAEARDSHTGGWTHIMETLESVLRK